MKKLFTFIAAALMAVSASAERKTIWTSESDGGTLLEWGSPNVKIEGVSVGVGDVLYLTVASTDTSIDAYPQATMCTSVGDSWEWTDLKNVLTPEAGEYAFEITEDMLEKITSHNQIFFKGTAAYVLKVEQETALALTMTTLWEGSQTFDESWSGNFTIDAEKFAGASAGDRLMITAKPEQATSWEYGAQVFLKTRRSGWAAIASTILVDAEGTYTVTITDTEQEIKDGDGNQVTTTMLAELKEHGLAVQGIVATVTKVELASAGTATEPDTKDFDLTNLDSGWGESTYDSATKTITIGNDWSGKGVWLGDKDFSHYSYLVAEFAEATATQGKLVVQSTTTGDDNGEDGLFGEKCLQKVTTLPTEKAHVTQFFIQGPAGSKYVLKRVYVATADYVTANGLADIYDTSDGIAVTAAAASQPAVRYNLAGQKVGAGYKGVVVENGRKVVVK